MSLPQTYTIVIVTYRRHRALCETLRALAGQIEVSAGELIVVAQCPAGPLPADVLQTPGLKYITVNRPSMVAARNIGIQHARGEVVLFLDDDVIPLPGLITSHLAAYADPNVGGVAGRIVDAGDEETSPPPHGKVFDPVDGWRYAQFNHRVSGDVMTARGCNMSFRREVLDRLGGFDPHIEIFRDDTDMCLRAIAHGYTVRFVPDAALMHLNAPSGGTRGEHGGSHGYWSRELRMYRQHYRHYRDNLYFLIRHFRSRGLGPLVLDAYRSYVGISRWPWRLVAKNVAFAMALAQASRLARIRRRRPCTLADCVRPGRHVILECKQ